MGAVPVVALGLGSVAGLGAARLAASHYSVMVKDISAIFVAGPPVVERARRAAHQAGARWQAHPAARGAVDDAVDTEEEAFARRGASCPTCRSVCDLPPRVRDDDPERRDEV